jgi:hypothetical protein
MVPTKADLLATSHILAPKDTGYFASTLYADTPGIFEYTIEIRASSDKPKAIWIREGTLPHMIFPTHGRALVFNVGGRTIFAANVHHPGTSANDWGDRVLDEVGPRALLNLKDMIDAA